MAYRVASWWWSPLNTHLYTSPTSHTFALRGFVSSVLNLVRNSVSPLMVPTMTGVEGSLVDSSSSCNALHSVSATLGASFCIQEGKRADRPPSEEYSRPRTVAVRADFLRPNSENRLESSRGAQHRTE